MSVRAAAEELVTRAASSGHQGRVLTEAEARVLTDEVAGYPGWLLELLTTVPLCGLELGWQAYDPEPTFDGVEWLEWCNAAGVKSESVDCYPGLAILPAGYINVAGDSTGGGDPYFICIHDGPDPPLYQVYHDVGSEAEAILRDGRRLVSAKLSEFFRSAIVQGEA